MRIRWAAWPPSISWNAVFDVSPFAAIRKRRIGRACGARAFANGFDEAGFACDIYQPPQTRSSIIWNREYPSVITWLQSLQKPVGIMACNDIRGRQVIEACSLGGMHVPNDVAVVGADEDLVLSELSNPPLSSVALNGEQGGYQAAELLHRMMLGQVKKPQRILVDPLWVVPRLSTDVIAVEDRDVAEAVRYIRENARRPLQIVDIVKHLGISRRALEIRFHRSLGWSIREEIERSPHRIRQAVVGRDGLAGLENRGKHGLQRRRPSGQGVSPRHEYDAREVSPRASCDLGSHLVDAQYLAKTLIAQNCIDHSASC